MARLVAQGTGEAVSGMIGLLLATLLTFKSQSCGVSFTLPHGWTAEVEARDKDDSPRELCNIAVRPPRWRAKAKKSRWDIADPPLTITIFKRGTRFESAATDSEFERDEQGKLGFPGFRGVLATAEEYRAGRYTGIVATPFFRGYLREGAKTRIIDGEEESNVYSGESEHVLLRVNGRVVGLNCEGGTPDEHIECDAAIRAVLRRFSLR